MSSFLYRGGDNRRLFNQTLTLEEFERREERRKASREAKERKNLGTTVTNVPKDTMVGKAVKFVKSFFSRGKH